MNLVVLVEVLAILDIFLAILYIYSGKNGHLVWLSRNFILVKICKILEWWTIVLVVLNLLVILDNDSC